MKDYTFKGEDKSVFMKNIKINKDKETMTVTYANGDVEVVPADEHNIGIAEKYQEKQARRGLRRAKKYVANRNDAIKNGVLLSTITGIATGEIANLCSDNPIVIATSVGTLAIATAIPNIIKFVRNSSKVKELKKIETLYENKEQLERMDEYNNPLQGTSHSAQELFQQSENPTSIIYIDSYTKDDIDKIIENMSREDTIGFNYEKVK